MRILIVEDDPVLSDGLRVGLSLFGATPDTVSNCAGGRAALALAEVWRKRRCFAGQSSSRGSFLNSNNRDQSVPTRNVYQAMPHNPSFGA
jgi:hypothetical protein